MSRLFFLFLLAPLISFSQERINSELPKIIDTIASIKSAKGWMKNDIGKWVNKPNAIPSENSDYNFPCSEFIEYSLLKMSYKNENYFCLIYKAKIETNFWVFNYFQNEKINSDDTTINLIFQPICEGNIFNSSNQKTELINEIYKEFHNENSLAQYDNLKIDLTFSKSKNYLRFFIYSTVSSSSMCGEEENPLEKKYFETSINNLSFFAPLISSN